MRVEIVDYSIAFSTMGEIFTDEHKAHTLKQTHKRAHKSGQPQQRRDSLRWSDLEGASSLDTLARESLEAA